MAALLFPSTLYGPGAQKHLWGRCPSPGRTEDSLSLYCETLSPPIRRVVPEGVPHRAFTCACTPFA